MEAEFLPDIPLFQTGYRAFVITYVFTNRIGFLVGRTLLNAIDHLSHLLLQPSLDFS